MKKPDYLVRRTKIVCTLGPATGTAAVIEKLIRGGMNVARLNLAHGTHALHRRYVQTVRKVSGRLGVPVAVIVDLPGPKYRVGSLEGGSVTLEKGARIILTSRSVTGNSALIPVSLPGITRDAKKGDTILLDDGAMQLKVLGKTGEDVTCRVVVGGVLTEKRGLAVPGMHDTGPFMTPALREHVRFAVKQDPDYLAVSFVSGAGDVTAVKAVIGELKAGIPVVAKIERVQAVRDFDRILEVSDGIMVARGDLGVDIALEKVPLIQKDIIHKCNRAGKPVITATQMLESMVTAARPTRAEVTDVANAIFDGTDATMLSGETSVGEHPVAAVRIMDKIAREVERTLDYESLLVKRGDWIEQETDEFISYSACHAAYHLKAAAIVAFTQSGITARRVSKYRPAVPVLAITPDTRIYGCLLLYWGVYPFRSRDASTVEELFANAVEVARDTGVARHGDLLVITGGVPVGVAGSTNLLKVERIE
jgi:pyruvate kinase